MIDLTRFNLVISTVLIYLTDSTLLSPVLFSSHPLMNTENIYLCQGGYVFIVVCLSVSTLRKTFQTDLHEIFSKG